MSVAQEVRRRLRAVVAPLLCLAALGYFVYHTINGDRGILAWWHLRQEIGKAEATLAETAAMRAAMERRASLMRPDNLDPDMLEEQARRLLNMSRDGDMIILQEPAVVPPSPPVAAPAVAPAN